jgi:hypothetical protein
MSSLIFHTDESQAYVATDTLGVSTDGRPLTFTTKAFIVPHLKLIVAGTGAGRFLGKWFVHINDHMIVRGIDHLDHHAPNVLATIWPGHQQEHSFQDVTATIYHFGFSEVTGMIHSFAYRSTNNFRSERIPYGIGAKPECAFRENCAFPSDIRKLMDEQRTIQASQPKEKRIYIGGEIQIHHLMKDRFHVHTLDRFEDYARDEAAIYDNFRESKTRDEAH